MRWHAVAPTLALSVLTPTVRPATDTGQIPEKGLSATSSPGWLAPSADGNLWFTDMESTAA